MPSRDVSPLLLRTLLIANAALSGSSGMVLLLAAPTLSNWLDVDVPWALQTIGMSLLLFTVWLIMSAYDTTPDPRDVRTAIALDASWMVGSVVVLATSWP